MILRWLATGLMTFAFGTAAHAALQASGQAPSGAWYRIEAPDGWAPGDALVLYQHGLDFSEASGPPGLGPLKSLMLDEGYAVAATSYRQRGWALFSAVEDNQELLAVVERELGRPGEIIPFGGSLGGLVALKVAEAPGFPPVQAAYSLCPAAAGARLWDTAIDLRLAYDVVCRNAGDLPKGDAPYPWARNLDGIPDDLGDFEDQVLLLPSLLGVNQCTGVNLPEPLRSSDKRRRLKQLMDFMHITDDRFFVTNIAYTLFVMSDLVRAPEKLDGHNPFTTAGVDYGSDPMIQAEIARLVAEPRAAERLHEVSDFRGEVGDAKVLSLHTSRDQLVIPSNQEFVRKVLPPDQLVSVLVDEDEPSHCGFSNAEGVAGWEALRAWRAGAAQPTAASLQDLCKSIVASGAVEGDCRFDPVSAIVPFDDRVRPRPLLPLQPPPRSNRPLPIPRPIGQRVAP